MLRHGLIWLLIASPALAQPPPTPTPSSRPSAPTPRPDRRAQRIERDRIIAATGESVRDFVESYGEDAVAALSRCSPEIGRQLGEFQGWKQLPRPGQMLRVIGRADHGDDVALWVLAHAKELFDPDGFDAFVLDPLSYALSLRKLDEGTARVRSFKANIAARERNTIIVFVVVLGIALFVIRRYRREGAF